jgi:HSP90 family molecular chaperone
LLGNICLLQKRIDEASRAYRACVQAGADTRPGQYAAMALQQIEEANKNDVKAADKEPAPPANPNSPRAAKQEEESQSILKALKEALDRNQKDFKIQADKLTAEEEQQIEQPPPTS